MANHVFYYDNDKNKPFYVSNRTLLRTPYTFQNPNINGFYEKQQVSTFYHSLVPRDRPFTLVDIGAQSGLYTLYAKYRPNGRFIAFEPYMPSFECLEENIKLNKLQNVECINKAVANFCGEATLNVCESHSGLNTLGSNPNRFNDIRKERVQVVTLDKEFYEKRIPVDFIKIDTEGGEYDVIKGSRETLLTYKPIILLEIVENNLKAFGKTPEDLYSLLLEFGYSRFTKIGPEEYIAFPSNS